jgi:ethanolamine transporter EutH
MKKNVLVFGLTSGLLLTAMMIYTTITCYSNPENFQSNDVVGYAAMILIFSLIFVGVKNYRDKYSNGVVTFGKAFRIGLYISLIAATMYTVVWLFEYYLFVPDFMDKYSAHVLQKARAGGASAAELTKKADEMATFKNLYRNPLAVVAVTYLEVLPIGVIVALISALILKRKQPRTAVS